MVRVARCLPSLFGSSFELMQRLLWVRFRGMANRSHDGIEDHKLKPIGGFCAETGAALTSLM